MDRSWSWFREVEMRFVLLVEGEWEEVLSGF